MLGMGPRQFTACLVALGLLAAACAADADAGVGGTGPATGSTVAITHLAELGAATDTSVAGVPDPRPTTIAIVGDSLTLSAEEQIRVALEPTGARIVGFDAVEGRRTGKRVDGKTSGAEAVAEIVAAGATPELWILALGTNDVGGQEDAVNFRTHVIELLAAIPADAPVIWVDAWIAGRIDASRTLNEVLRGVAAGRSGMTVIDWFQFGDDPGIIRGDGVHLTDAGKLKFAEQLVKEYQARFP